MKQKLSEGLAEILASYSAKCGINPVELEFMEPHLERIKNLFTQHIKAKMPEKKDLRKISYADMIENETGKHDFEAGRNQAIQETTKALLEDM